MLQYVLNYERNSLRGLIRLFPVNVPHLFIVNILFHIHCFNVINTEGKHIFVVYGVYYRVGMQPVAKCLRRGGRFYVFESVGVFWENRCTCKSENVIFFKFVDNSLVHITKLTAVAFVKNYYNMLTVNLMLGIFLNKGCQLLNSGNYYIGVIVFKLFFQNRGGRIAVCRTLFKAVVFLHCLIIQILAVNHKKYLVYIFEL